MRGWKEKYGPWAIVTGASSGIGREFCLQVARLGVNLVLVARREDRLRSIAAQCEIEGIETLVVVADLLEDEAIGAIAEAIGSREVGLLVNCAGYAMLGDFEKLDTQKQLDMIKLNCTASVALTAAMMPPMLERRRGGMIQVASMVGTKATPWFSTYAATKAFALSYSQAVGEEVRGRGVDVLALCPGLTRTEFMKLAGIGPSIFPVMTPEKVVAKALRALGRKRVLVTGFGNWSFVILLTRILTNGLAIRLTGWSMRIQRPRQDRER